MKQFLFVVALAILFAFTMTFRIPKNKKEAQSTIDQAAAVEPENPVPTEEVKSNAESIPATAPTAALAVKAPVASVEEKSAPTSEPLPPANNPQIQVAESELASAGCTFSDYQIPGTQHGVIKNKLSCANVGNVATQRQALQAYIKKLTESAKEGFDNSELYDRSASAGDALVALVRQNRYSLRDGN
jgi:hypothetical protein